MAGLPAAHLGLEDADGVNFTAMAALDSRTRRRLARRVDPE